MKRRETKRKKIEMEMRIIKKKKRINGKREREGVKMWVGERYGQ